MLYSIMSYYSILVNIILEYTITILYYTILYYTVLYYTIIHYTIIYYTLSSRTRREPLAANRGTF